MTRVVLHHSQRGSVLFLVLLSTALISYLAHRLVSSALAYSSLVRNFDDGLSHQQAMRARLQRPLVSMRACNIQTLGQLGGGGQDWYTCTTGAQPFLVNPSIPLPSGRIDYNAIFAKATPCVFTRSTESLTRFSSPHAEMTCHPPELLSADLITTDNIAAEELLFSSSTPTAVTTIAAVGALRIAGALRLTTRTLIIAGGDISLAQIVSDNGTSIAVTIVSAHGDIQVGSTGHGVSLLVLGRQLRVVPPTAPSSSAPLPPFISPPFSGIRPLSAG